VTDNPNEAHLRQKHADYLDWEKDALTRAKAAHDSDHRKAMEQVASTWRLLAEMTGRELATLKIR
jgi:hypothetical protein